MNDENDTETMQMPNYVLALDQGTTSSRAILFDRQGRVASVSQQEFPQIFPRAGWVEHNPEDIWSSQLYCAREALSKAGARAEDVAAIGITNQRETTVVWDRASGQPIHNAIVWQCRRTALMCDKLKREKFDRVIRKKTGLVTDAYFSGTKVAWLLENVKYSSEVYAETDPDLFGAPIRIAGDAGDQQAALFGQACFRPGMMKNTYGTGCFLLMNTGEKANASKTGLLTTIAWRANGGTEYALEGSVFIAGAAVQWLRDGLNIIGNAAETEALATSVNDNHGVYFVPAFVGLGAPYWDADARGAIVGLTRGATRAHIARAAIEAMAYQTRDVVECMQTDSGIRAKELRVDGGATRNDFLCQFQADILGISVVRPVVTETTALGAAYLAGLAVNFWKSEKEISAQWREEKRFEPGMRRGERERLYEGWKEAVARARS